MRKNSNRYLLAAMALFVLPISGLSIDIYIPSLPAIGQYFGVTKASAQLTVTSYMIGLGIMQLFAGGVSDSFGRKKPFLISMAIFILATIFIPFSQSIYQLLLLRLIQGLAVGMMVVPLRSVIPDLFTGRELYKMMNYMVMAWSIGPIIAPAIGGYLQHYFGWKANFYFLTLYSALGFGLILFFLPETSQHHHPFHPKQIFQRAKSMLAHYEYMSSIMTNGLLYSIIILFAVVGPFLFQQVLHFSVIEFGHTALLIGLAWFMGATTNRLLTHVDFNLKATICLTGMLIVSCIMALRAVLLPLNAYTILIPTITLTWLGGIIFPNHFARGMALFPTASGTANALFGAFIFLIAGINSGLATHLKSTTQLPLALAYIGLVSACLLIHYTVNQRQQTANPKDIS
jgi:DHA1 family bicyclomycin/chloramphenicol resistance-like MFS transporter